MPFVLFQCWHNLCQQFCGSPLPPPSTLIGVLVVLAMTDNKLSKMVDSSTSCPFNRWWTMNIAIESSQITSKYLFSFPRFYILQIIKISISKYLYVIIVHGSWAFSYVVTYMYATGNITALKFMILYTYIQTNLELNDPLNTLQDN